MSASSPPGSSRRYVGPAPEQVREFLAEEVRPILEGVGELPAATDLEV